MHLDEEGFKTLFAEYASFKLGHEKQWQFSEDFGGDTTGYLEDLKGILIE